MNGIAREFGIYPLTPSVDHSDKEGYAVTVSGGTATISTSATVHPFGVIAEGQDTDGRDTIVAFAGANKPVYVKLDATPGTVVQGSLLVVTATGTFQLDPGTGARVTCAQAMEAGGAGALIEAILFKPVTGS